MSNKQTSAICAQVINVSLRSRWRLTSRLLKPTDPGEGKHGTQDIEHSRIADPSHPGHQTKKKRNAGAF